LGGFSSLCRDVKISLASNRQQRKNKMQKLLWLSGANPGNAPTLLLREIPVAFPPGGV
jgi:hypothetical protein